MTTTVDAKLIRGDSKREVQKKAEALELNGWVIWDEDQESVDTWYAVMIPKEWHNI